MGQLPVDDMQIGAAHAAGVNFDCDLSSAGTGILEVRVFKCGPWLDRNTIACIPVS